jgi:hypothetical protein
MMTSKTIPGYILLGDKPTLHTIWPDEPFRWKFDEWDRHQPPCFEMINIGIDNVWAINIDSRYRHPETGDVIVYGTNTVPVGIERDGVLL